MSDRRTQRYDEDDDDGRVRTKKKKKKKQKASRWPKLALFAGLGVLTLGLAIWALVKLTGGAAPAQPVTAWERFITEENEFGFDYPANWKVRSYGLHDKREVDVTGSGGALINVKENLTGSLVGDIANAANRGREVEDELLPVARVHELRRPQERRSYQEEPAVTVTTKFGKARRSAYKDGSKRGYRVTVLMHQTALDVFCECRASDWETLQPAFDRVIASLGRGG
jgi:hypothetical protein